MMKFFKNLFNLNKIVEKQESILKELEAQKIEFQLLTDKFNQITTK